MLPADVEACPVQLPGRGSRFREAPFRKVADLVPALAEGLLPLLDLPFALFGHSMGAVVAFELARELRRRRGREPVLLGVSGRHAPQRPDPHRHRGRLPCGRSPPHPATAGCAAFRTFPAVEGLRA